MAHNPHFKSVSNWKQASTLISFEPLRPKFTAGFSLSSLSVHVMDHRKRQLSKNTRSLEAHYNGGFVLDQKRASSVNEAKRMALSTGYGPSAVTIQIAGHEGRSYDLGPEPPPDDRDGRMPAVVVWYEEDLFFLVASTQLKAEVLLRVAESMYT